MDQRIGDALRLLDGCQLCPRACGARRLEDEVGWCGVGRWATVASYHLHFGEERPLVGQGGSGTIFFGGCNLGCHFCQNHDISRPQESLPAVSPERLAAMMTALQRQGAININFVTPSHVVPQILEALPLAYAAGLRIPLVYNSSAYDSPAALSLLDRLIDIYLPDAKLMDRVRAKRWCQAEDYPDVARLAIKTMHDQVGDLVVDDAGVAQRGLLVRHLLLPHGGSDTEAWMEFLARDVSRQTYVNIMDQYAPCGRVALRPLDFPDLQGWVSPRELTWAYGCARRCGLTRLDGFLSP